MAQRLAQGTHNPWVGGSNPSGPTNFSQVRGYISSGLFLYRLLRVANSHTLYAINYPIFCIFIRNASTELSIAADGLR